MQPTDHFLSQALAAMIETGNILDPTKVFAGLSLAIPSTGQMATIADMRPPPGGLATRQAVTPWSAPYKAGSGLWVVDGPTLRFVPAGPQEACVVPCWFLADAATGGTLLAYGGISPSRAFVDQSSSFSLVPRISLDPASRWAPSIQVGS